MYHTWHEGRWVGGPSSHRWNATEARRALNVLCVLKMIFVVSASIPYTVPLWSTVQSAEQQLRHFSPVQLL